MKNGQIWKDIDGQTIQAHGGMILEHEGVYYWYGENKDTLTVNRRVDFIGVSCYSSVDVHNWKYEGIVLEAEKEDVSSEIHTSKVGERPKVIYNKKSKQFVMWLHVDIADYSYARAGVAVSDSPVGPFHYLGSRGKNYGDCRDMTLFKDKDATAYLIHSSDWNRTLYISELNEDYTDLTGRFTRIFVDQYREAPAMVYEGGKYYLVTSGCTGWRPNSALYGVSEHILSNEWRLIDNPCSGKNYRRTFEGQSTYIFTVKGKHYVMLDHWQPEDLRNSGYSILSIQIEDDRMDIPWTEEW